MLVLVQISRDRFSALAACTINNAAVVRPAANESQKLFVSRRFGDYAVRQVRAIKAGYVTRAGRAMLIL